MSEEESLFVTILAECGVKLSTDPEIPHTTNQEQSLVRRALEAKLNSDNIPVFLSQLNDHCQNEDQFKALLSPTLLQKESGNSAKSIKEESLFHALLRVNCLQDNLMEMVLAKLIERTIAEDLIFFKLTLQTLSFIPAINKEEAMTDSLLEVLDMAEFPFKVEMFQYLPRIITLKQLPKIIDRLFTLMNEDENITQDAMICLNSFYLSKDEKARITKFILTKLLKSIRYHEIFGMLFRFLMQNLDDKQLLMEARPSIDKLMLSDKQESKDEFHKALLSSLRGDKKFYDIVLKFPIDQHTPVDFYLLLVLLKANPSKESLVEAVIKRKIKSNGFRQNLLQTFFDKYLCQEIINDLHEVLVDLAVKLVEAHTESNSIYSATGTFIIKMLFVHELFKGKGGYVIRSMRKSIMLSNQKVGHLMLQILRDLSMAKNLEDYGNILMPFLELHDTLTLRNFRLLIEIIAPNILKSLIFLEHLRLCISKLTNSSVLPIAKKGIVGSIVLAKHLSLGATDIIAPGAEPEYETPLAIAKELLDRTMCRENAERLGLYYDELALSISPETHTYILNWLFEDLTTKFQNAYIVDTVPTSVGLQVPLKVQFELNSAEETEETLYINIGEFVQTKSLHKKVTVLSPLFRLIRLVNLYQKNDPEMNNIDALLGCGLLLPDIEDLETYGNNDLKIVADCLFHAINWFRECVSAFITLTNRSIRLKVIHRVKHIVQLEEKLDECMALAADHKLPPSYFYEESQPQVDRFKRPAAKRPHGDTTGNTSTSTGRGRKAQNTSVLYYGTFREIDIDVVILLKYTGIIPELTSSQVKSLDSKQFQFILRDTIGKLDAVLNKKLQHSETLNDTKPETLLSHCEKLLPYVHKHFKQVVQEISTVLENNDNCYDSEVMFNSRSNDLKQSFGLVLQFYKLIFSWEQFSLDNHHKQLKAYLKYFHSAERASRDSSLNESFQVSLTLASNDTMLQELITNMSNYKGYCLLLSSASNIIILLKHLRQLLNANMLEADKVIAKTANELLKKRWRNKQGVNETGCGACEQIQGIILAYLDGETVETITEIVSALQTEVENLKGSDDTLEAYRAIDKSNIRVFYKCICLSLLNKLKLELRSLTDNGHLVIWSQIGTALQGMIIIAKTLKSNINLKAISKYALMILNVFLTLGIPMMNLMLRRKPNDVQEIISKLQITTKFLHQLCCQVSHDRNLGFLHQVPQIRGTLTKFFFAVKGILIANNCIGALWTGVLKNRNIHGEDIIEMSQSTTADDEDMDIDTGFDDIDDDDNSENSEHFAAQSASEVFP